MLAAIVSRARRCAIDDRREDTNIGRSAGRTLFGSYRARGRNIGLRLRRVVPSALLRAPGGGNDDRRDAF